MKVLELFGIYVMVWLEHYASANAGVNFQKVQIDSSSWNNVTPMTLNKVG